MTFGLAAVLIAVYWLELHFSVDPMPLLKVSARDSVAFGGISPDLVFREKEWWRIFTAPWLHGSLSHLIGNIIALVFAGLAIERILGREWLAALFAAGALGGSLGSLAYTDWFVSVGASGALMCLITVLFALSFHGASGEKAARLRWRALFVMVSAFLPSAGAAHIDFGAHFGGFAVGIASGFLLLILWPEDNPKPPLRNAAFCVATAGASVTIFAALQVQAYLPIYNVRSAELIPFALIDGSHQTLLRQRAELAERFPHDPLARLLNGLKLIAARDDTDAEGEARTGLGEDVILRTEYPPDLREKLEMLLAASLWEQGRRDEANPTVAHICASNPTDPFLADGRKYFVNAGACR